MSLETFRPFLVCDVITFLKRNISIVEAFGRKPLFLSL